MKIYQKIALILSALEHCTAEWTEKHHETLEKIFKLAPSGSGIDCGTKLNFEKSTSEKLVFEVSFHHMNNDGFYTRWTEHFVIVKPSLAFDIDLKITGQNHNSIKEYLHEVYSHWLTSDYQENA